jgi:Asp-tRNA(Asn)/Glu-tRNA(Gln) amidotransferase A subunit family amidase
VISLEALAAAYRARRVSPVEATRACLERIARLDTALNAFITVTADRALDDARTAEIEIGAGRDRGPLHGVPIALKDLIDTAGIATTGASALFAERVPDADAEVVRRLRAAGAVLLGKLNLHELAYGGSGVISAYGPVRNPRNPAHITGGSSSGSAAAVAAGLCYAALGTDTAGSIRLPAALCGVVGMKPSHGLVSADGVLPLAPSYDCVGPMTRTVRDAALVLDVLAGTGAADGGRPRIGVARAHFFADLDAEVAAAVEAALDPLARLGAGLRDVSLPVDDDRALFHAEVWAFHHRFVAGSPERYQPETLRRIRAGASVTAAQAAAAARVLERTRRDVAQLFADVDLIVTPTAPALAPSFAELEARPDELRAHELRLLRNTRPFNILGLPTLTLPCGRARSGLPIGLSIAGPAGADASVLGFGAALEREIGDLDLGAGE